MHILERSAVYLGISRVMADSRNWSQCTVAVCFVLPDLLVDLNRAMNFMVGTDIKNICQLLQYGFPAICGIQPTPSPGVLAVDETCDAVCTGLLETCITPRADRSHKAVKDAVEAHLTPPRRVVTDHYFGIVTQSRSVGNGLESLRQLGRHLYRSKHRTGNGHDTSFGNMYLAIIRSGFNPAATLLDGKHRRLQSYVAMADKTSDALSEFRGT